MDTIKYTLLDNGDVKIETSKVSQPNHLNAENLLKGITEALGGKSEVKRKSATNSQHHHEVAEQKS